MFVSEDCAYGSSDFEDIVLDCILLKGGPTEDGKQMRADLPSGLRRRGMHVPCGAAAVNC